MDEAPLPRVACGVVARSGCAVCRLRGCGRMLTRRVDRERLLTASTHFSHSLSVFLSLLGVRRVAARFCGRWFSLLFLPDCLVLRSPRGCSPLLPTDVSDVLSLFLCSSPPLEHTHARKEAKKRYSPL
ncbi:hypothetical protein Tc00.1047053510907.20 [Trypanosoma cruzi]|uniref:Uncharacterized protein n=1 Tax=Trypanosoma cruzi (strain CL Brener) TaxID=353153 RepID=Q4CLV5_TRYCC|nr:hypothetical protein Tc00.1047053507051.20 [Trypanosoma cruzi]XP_804012.1 hypothetical protein Tc00.1047053510907.20 [Trypanosoma cruzi]EAN81257.1 hypothetical protein Tc00.1047053507051.20 [Trypanosoma cruzi]EAN82161.1 hypothetical protein Tc00.1047053510907.20 [Trypanosoma cruzi]|eukprot:XP_802703.1 hypothetical protein [Trypanosoma cruzi strain CL Brener]